MRGNFVDAEQGTPTCPFACRRANSASQQNLLPEIYVEDVFLGATFGKTVRTGKQIDEFGDWL